MERQSQVSGYTNPIAPNDESYNNFLDNRNQFLSHMTPVLGHSSSISITTLRVNLEQSGCRRKKAGRLGLFVSGGE